MEGTEQDEMSAPAVDRGRAVLEAFVRVAMLDAVDPTSRIDQSGPVADASDEQVDSGETR